MNRAKELGRDDVWINSELGWNMGRLDRNEEAVYYLKDVYKRQCFNSCKSRWSGNK